MFCFPIKPLLKTWLRLMLLALLTFSSSVIWFSVEISKVESTRHYCKRREQIAGVLAITSIFLAFLIIFSNLSFQFLPSGELGSVVMNMVGKASCCSSPLFLPRPAQIVEKKLNLIYKCNSMHTVDFALI